MPLGEIRAKRSQDDKPLTHQRFVRTGVTGRRSTQEDARERLAQSLYEAMEELSDDLPGEPWAELPEAYKPWYRDCVVGFLRGSGLQLLEWDQQFAEHDDVDRRPDVAE